jgi:hypothetical protein
VLNGTHVLLREFSYVNRCARDRLAFVQSVREAFADLDQEQPASASVLLQLLRLVCQDFPLDIATDACRLCGNEVGSHPLRKLLHATCVRICFADFLRRVAAVFESCDEHQTGRVQRPVVGLALRTATLALAGAESCPPVEIFDALVSGSGDISLHEIEQLVTHSPPMLRLFCSAGLESDGTLAADSTLVASPPPRGGEATSPGSACAAAVSAAAAAAAVGGSNGGRRGGRTVRERLAEAAATAACAAAAGGGGSRRAASAGPARISSAARRRGTGPSLASRLLAATNTAPSHAATGGTPR